MKIRGKIIKGIGAASNTIAQQKIYFKPYINNIDDYYDGTINVLLESPLFIREPKIITPIIRWGKEGRLGKFGFHQIKLELEKKPPAQNEVIECYIYIPYNSPLYNNLFLMEILAPKINLAGVDYCNIIIEEEAREVGIFVVG